MEYDAVFMVSYVEKIENVISVYVADAPVLCDSGNRLRAWQMV